MAAEPAVPTVLQEVYLAFIEDADEVEDAPVVLLDSDDDNNSTEPADNNTDEEEWNSKIGGVPDWLAPLKELPLCPGSCGAPMPLLVQIYAPLDELTPDAYHRFLYIFACPTVSCHERASPYVVVRYQQPAAAPQRPALARRKASPGFPLCPVCGHYAGHVCGRCRAVHYCTRQHQVAHWKAGHKLDCGKHAGKDDEALKLLDGWDEFRLETAREQDVLQQAEPIDASADAATLLKGTLEAVRNHKKGVEVNDEDFQQNKEHIDSQMLKFQAAVKPAPDQVLRYGQPVLWVHSKNQPLPEMIPACQRCGAARHYEFQVLPQLLYYLHVDSKASPLSPVSINFATLAIYTCSKSCGTGYSPEFLWVQHE